MKTLMHARLAGQVARALAIAAVMFALLGAPRPAHALPTVRYVTVTGLSSGTCTTWGTACNLQYALTTVVLSGSGDQVWVAAGVYKPHASDVAVSFVIPPTAQVYGGFDGAETDVAQQDPSANVTILSGDVAGNDVNVDGNYIAETSANIVNTNSYHVVKIDGTSVDVTASTVLDGFVITGGRANAVANDSGGGLYCNGSGAGHECSPTLAHLIFSGNWAWYGGGLYNNGQSGGASSPTLTDVTFTGNNNGGTGSGVTGGGMYNAGSGGTSSPSLTRVTFSANGNSGTGNAGGGMLDDGAGGISSPTLTNVTFSGNAALFGGGLSHSGGDFSELTLTNVTFSGNSAANSGGAIWSSGSGQLTNVILWGNSATGFGPEIYSDANLQIGWSVVQGSGGSGGAWDTGLGADLGANLDADPQLIALADNGGFTWTMALQAGSPAIDAADNGSFVACGGTDQRGQSCPQGPHCDIGAFEAGYPFFDVPVPGKEWMEPWIEAFYYAGVTTGCGSNPLIYCPENQVTRAEMAVFLLRAKHGSGYVPPAPTHDFADVPVTGKEWMEPWIEQFYAEGITTGCGGGNYCPENNVTRAEMAVFVLRALHGMGYAPPAASGVFGDVPVSGKEWMEPWIIQFYNEGITTGCGGGNYCPENNVTRAEMAVFIDRAYHFYP